jgi:hypothetical protein
MHHIVASQPGLQREHGKNRQCGEAKPRITERCPRQHTQRHERAHRQQQTIHRIPRGAPAALAPASSLWCTGKDSNLRTSEEGQIYSLLALTTHPPVQNCGTVRPFAVHFGHSSQIFTQPAEMVQTDSAKVRICKREEQKCARECHRTQTPHLENSLMECRWKIC